MASRWLNVAALFFQRGNIDASSLPAMYMYGTADICSYVSLFEALYLATLERISVVV